MKEERYMSICNLSLFGKSYSIKSAKNEFTHEGLDERPNDNTPSISINLKRYLEALPRNQTMALCTWKKWDK